MVTLMPWLSGLVTGFGLACFRHQCRKEREIEAAAVSEALAWEAMGELAAAEAQDWLAQQ